MTSDSEGGCADCVGIASCHLGVTYGRERCGSYINSGDTELYGMPVGCRVRFPFRYTGTHIGRELWAAYREGRAPVLMSHEGYQLELCRGDFATPV